MLLNKTNRSCFRLISSRVTLIGITLFVVACSTLPKNPEKPVSYNHGQAKKAHLLNQATLY
jgi:hypothetical protein